MKDARDKPIFTMLELIRTQIMCRFQEKREWIVKWKGSICPKIHEKIEAIRVRAMDYESFLTGDECGKLKIQRQPW